METPSIAAKLLIAQYAVTALSSAFNTGYFWNYRSPLRGRRFAALLLAVFNLAVLIESVYSGAFTLLRDEGWSRFFLSPGPRLAAGTLLCLSSAGVSILIMRRLLWKRGRR